MGRAGAAPTRKARGSDPPARVLSGYTRMNRTYVPDLMLYSIHGIAIGDGYGR